ncbi:MAG: hypothetical protein V4582_20250 [Pseudomonadota bacterium]
MQFMSRMSDAWHTQLGRFNATTVRHKIAVLALFDFLTANLPVDTRESAWISSLKDEATRNQLRWKDRLNCFIEGLVASKALSDDGAAQARNYMQKCQDTGLFHVTASPMVWAGAGSFVLAAGFARAGNLWSWSVVFLALGALGVWEIRNGRWLSPPELANQKTRAVLRRGYIVGAVIAPILIAAAVIICTPFAIGWSKLEFNNDQAAFRNDPNGLPMIQKFARENYNITVVLSSTNWGWKQTALILPNNSVGTMSVGNGYCYLSFFRSSLLGSWGIKDSTLSTGWTQGVMVHELGHCLDISRDVHGFDGQVVSTLSVAPTERSQVKNVSSFVEVGEQVASGQWREAIADIMAVGFWRQRFPMQADRLIANLIEKRKSDDQAHTTGCWINFAMIKPAPSAPRDLLDWATGIRASAPCTLTST